MNFKENKITITKFLSAFYQDENETIHLISLQAKGFSANPKYFKTNGKSFSNDIQLQKQLLNTNNLSGIYFFVNSGGTKDAQITRFNAFFVENDVLPIEEQHRLLDESPIQPSIRVETKKSVHAYWLIDGNCSAEDWREIQKTLISHFDSDKSIKNLARCMRLPFFNHVSCDGEQIIRKKVDITGFNPSQRFTVKEMRDAFSRIKIENVTKPVFEEISAEFVNSLNSYETNEIANLYADVQVNIKDVSSLNSLQSVVQIESGSFPVQETEETKPLSKPLSKRKCFYGLAGEIVKTIEPHTEADSMALLLNTLAGFGNAIGRNSYFEADGSKHYTNLFGVLVGTTSAGKGTSWNQIKRLFESVDEDWAQYRIQSGLSSGEGLIAAVKDGEGEVDKRLFVVESEFSSVLSMGKRDGNTLSANIRGFWDNGKAQTLTKVDPISTSDAHVSIIGHITPTELRYCLGRTEIANGFANRFLWVQVKRSKSLPDGGKLPTEEFDKLVEKLSEAVKLARTIEEIKRNEEANDLWREVYPQLTAERSGAFGSVTSRSRPQIVRLSIIYALMDKSNVIMREHLEAALDFWNYCEESARQIFGESTGDKLADDIYKHLKSAKEGLSKTDIINKTGKNYSADQIQSSIQVLCENGLIHSIKEKRQENSRVVEFWYRNEFNEFENSENQSETEDLGLPV